MDKLPASKKVVLVIGQFIIAALMYGVVIYLLDLFFESDHRYTLKSITIQSVVFGLLFTLWTVWSANRKMKKEKRKQP